MSLFSSKTSKCKLAYRILSDIIVVILLHVAYYIIRISVSPKTGFFCDDTGIRYPYKGDTVSDIAVSVYGYGVPLVLIVIVELLTTVYRQKVLRKRTSYEWTAITIYIYAIASIITGGVTFFLTSVVKYRYGYTRRTFLDVCKPNVDITTCVGYQENYICQGDNEREIKETYLSVISGHASMASMGAIFSVIYLQHRLHLYWAPMLRVLLQTILIASSLYICVTRYTDFRHLGLHLTAGYVLGTSCAIGVYYGYVTSASRFIDT